jgi:hypothetical protein
MLVAVFGAVVHSLLLLRGGLILIAAATASIAVFRILAFQPARQMRLYGMISVGSRLAAALVLLYLAASIHF